MENILPHVGIQTHNLKIMNSSLKYHIELCLDSDNEIVGTSRVFRGIKLSVFIHFAGVGEKIW